MGHVPEAILLSYVRSTLTGQSLTEAERRQAVVYRVVVWAAGPKANGRVATELYPVSADGWRGGEV